MSSIVSLVRVGSIASRGTVGPGRGAEGPRGREAEADRGTAIANSARSVLAKDSDARRVFVFGCERRQPRA